jgi:hypothetical protein
MVSPDALVLTHALEKLRARDGLTHSRLDNSRSVEAAPLLGLAAVRRYAAVHDIELAPSLCGRRRLWPQKLPIIRCRTQCLTDGVWNSSLNDPDSISFLAALRSAMQATPILSRYDLRFPFETATIDH